MLPETDFQAAGDQGLGLHRQYRSMHAYGSLFGPQWLSNFDYPRLIVGSMTCDRNMVCVPKTVTVTQPDGARFVYSLSGSSGVTSISKPVSRSASAAVPPPYDQHGRHVYIYGSPQQHNHGQCRCGCHDPHARYVVGIGPR
ncbi:DUF6531 domain-containing protein [Pseudoduganella ginsengisoli]|uniref:DUF6531 domain-containing protein n=1 Tax=Pseudoduganella ginsengisoli TaxID=1462440 RepID=UPI003530E9E4